MTNRPKRRTLVSWKTAETIIFLPVGQEPEEEPIPLTTAVPLTTVRGKVKLITTDPRNIPS